MALLDGKTHHHLSNPLPHKTFHIISRYYSHLKFLGRVYLAVSTLVVGALWWSCTIGTFENDLDDLGL
jgi:hypothetical protein